MEKAFETQAIEKMIKLPLKVITFTDRPFNSVIVKTPMGEREVSFKDKNYPFLFGSTTETEKSLHKIISELRELEDESKEYLLNGWVEKEKYISNQANEPK